MALIALCPRCSSPLGLPADVDCAARAQCPLCEVEFSLDAVAPRELPLAKMVDDAPAEDVEAGLLSYDDVEIDEEEVILKAPSATLAPRDMPRDLQTSPRRQRRPAGLRLLAGIVGGGVIGLLLGAYALLWIQGPQGDVAGLVRWLPSMLLPESAQNVP
jgi:hypothetical protein